MTIFGEPTTIRLRRAYAATWTLKNPLLVLGEPGFERDTGKFKIGDGVNRWIDLPYFVPHDTAESNLAEHINSLTPHPVYDDGPSFEILYQNAKV